MPYNFAADSFHTKKLCGRLSSSEVRFFTQIGRFAFLRPPLGDLGATYDYHLTLIGKRVGDFLLALIELFSLGVTAEALRAIIGSKSTILLQGGPVDPKFGVEGVAPTNHSSTQKTRLNVVIWYINLDRSFYRFVTIHACDRRTDGQTDKTECSSLDRVCIPCSAVKTGTCFHFSKLLGQMMMML